MSGIVTESIATGERRKKLIRRSAQDRSQRIRHAVQWLFVALNGWIGVQFYLWVRYFERGGQGLYVPRPAGVEGWLPIAGLMNSKYLLLTGRVPAIHPAAMYLFLGFLLMSVLLEEGVLLVAMSRWNAIGESLAARAPRFRAQSAPAEMGRYSTTRT